MKLLSGILLGILLTLGSLVGAYKYATSPTGQVGRCMDLYVSQGIETDEAVVALAIKNGQTVKELIQSRCQGWVANGQKF